MVWTQIITALLVGLLTAFAFQLLLTTVGVAIGLTALGFQVATPSDSTAELDDSAEAEEGASHNSSASPIGTMAGIGVLLTINLVLFGACFVAVKVSQFPDPLAGAIAGLVIWSAYFLLLTWVSSTAVSAVIGSVLGAATGGFRQLMTTIAAAFQGNDDTQMTQERAIALIQQEIQQAFSPAVLELMIQQSLTHHPALNQAIQMNSALIPALLQQTSNSAGQSGEPVEPDGARNKPNTTETSFLADDGGDRPLDTSPAVTDQFWQDVEAFLSAPRSKPLTSKQVRHKVEALLEATLEPSCDLRYPVAFDRPRFKALLKQQETLSKKQRRRILHHTETIWENLQAQLEEDPSAEMQPDSSQEGRFGTLQPIINTVGSALQKLGDGLSNETIDLGQMLPQHLSVASIAATAIQRQLHQMDWEPLLDRLSLRNLDDDQVEQWVADVRSLLQELMDAPQDWADAYLVPQTEDLKGQVTQYVDHIQHRIQHQLDGVKQQAQQRLEATRKAATAAAWWVSAIAFTGAMSAAIAGGLAAGGSLPAYLRF